MFANLELATLALICSSIRATDTPFIQLAYIFASGSKLKNRKCVPNFEEDPVRKMAYQRPARKVMLAFC